MRDLRSSRLPVQDLPPALRADVPPPDPPVPRRPPVARGATDLPPRRPPRRRHDAVLVVAPHRTRPDPRAHRPPPRPVTGPGRQRVGDLVQHRVPHLVEAIEKRQRPRQRDPLVRVIAPPKATPRVIECERPAVRVEAVFTNELFCEVGGFVEVHPCWLSLLWDVPQRARL